MSFRQFTRKPCERSNRPCGYCATCEREARRFARVHPIKGRIEEVLAGGKTDYHALARLIFPDDITPRAWRYSSNGGPPGCYMALSRAIREMGLRESFSDHARYVYPKSS